MWLVATVCISAVLEIFKEVKTNKQKKTSKLVAGDLVDHGVT